jgi:hypothetical protein
VERSHWALGLRGTQAYKLKDNSRTTQIGDHALWCRATSGTLIKKRRRERLKERKRKEEKDFACQA